MLLALVLVTGEVTAASPPDRIAALDTAGIATPERSDWPGHGRDYREQRYSPLDAINRQTVGELGLAWSFDTDFSRGIEATPIVVDGTMFVTGNWSVVYALDAKTGALKWTFDPQVPKAVGAQACCDVVNRGVAAYQGRIYVGTLDARLIALDAKTGKKIWDVQTADRSQGDYTITGAPRVAKGKVYIGNGGAEFGVRGYVTAYDAKSGKQLWRFYTVPGDPSQRAESPALDMARTTWHGEWWTLGGGGTVWDAIVYDPELDQLLIGVGNGSPWDRGRRSPGGGDNLFLSSIVALDPDTGSYRWHYQETPGDTWDYTATQPIMLADMRIGGQDRKVLWHAPKNGFFYVVDRRNGKLISAEPFSRVTWAKGYDLDTGRPIENAKADWTLTDEPTTVYPYSGGAHNWQPMAHSPQTGLVYIPEVQLPGTYVRIPISGKNGAFNTGSLLTGKAFGGPLMIDAMTRKVGRGQLVAWDPETQSERWRIRHDWIANGGVLATAGGLVFQGLADDVPALAAFDAETGIEAWRYPTQDVPIAAPIAYEVDGEQYIAVGVGRGGAIGIVPHLDDQPLPAKGRFVAFKLGASAQLPPATLMVDYGDPPPPATTDDAVLAAGERLYREHCLRCHGGSGISNRRYPDLRRLPRAYYEQFDAIVLEGSVATLGMPAFGDRLTPDDAAAIEAYLLVEAQHDQQLRAGGWWIAVKRWTANVIATIVSWMA